ncbi:hypothetical protein [Jiella mangrovi]|uniref:Uncharacterized protein n=1 Tax=Jiella mangrovi TaxID=2821407 RepID=A0ABS4BEK4_9HYPH|nr:hypothetical protein [Jiella mangrovi]MBP0615178.1 hypothetical protein [Jiella mangrovi]
MPDLDTDPKMMREQQDRDTKENAGEKDGARRQADSDAQSAAERQAALEGEGGSQEDQMDAILRQNGAKEGSSKPESAEPGHPKKGLVRRGRSLLGG